MKVKKKVKVRKKQESIKNREWERERRGKLNALFVELGSLLPDHDPSKPRSKVATLAASIAHITHLTALNAQLIDERDLDSVYVGEMSGLRERMDALRRRCEQLAELLQMADIPVPSSEPRSSSASAHAHAPLKWNGGITHNTVKQIIISRRQQRHNDETEKKENKEQKTSTTKKKRVKQQVPVKKKVEKSCTEPCDQNSTPNSKESVEDVSDLPPLKKLLDVCTTPLRELTGFTLNSASTSDTATNKSTVNDQSEPVTTCSEGTDSAPDEDVMVTRRSETADLTVKSANTNDCQPNANVQTSLDDSCASVNVSVVGSVNLSLSSSTVTTVMSGEKDVSIACLSSSSSVTTAKAGEPVAGGLVSGGPVAGKLVPGGPNSGGPVSGKKVVEVKLLKQKIQSTSKSQMKLQVGKSVNSNLVIAPAVRPTVQLVNSTQVKNIGMYPSLMPVTVTNASNLNFAPTGSQFVGTMFALPDGRIVSLPTRQQPTIISSSPFVINRPMNPPPTTIVIGNTPMKVGSAPQQRVVFSKRSNKIPIPVVGTRFVVRKSVDVRSKEIKVAKRSRNNPKKTKKLFNEAAKMKLDTIVKEKKTPEKTQNNENVEGSKNEVNVNNKSTEAHSTRVSDDAITPAHLVEEKVQTIEEINKVAEKNYTPEEMQVEKVLEESASTLKAAEHQQDIACHTVDEDGADNDDFPLDSISDNECGENNEDISILMIGKSKKRSTDDDINGAKKFKSMNHVSECESNGLKQKSADLNVNQTLMAVDCAGEKGKKEDKATEELVDPPGDSGSFQADSFPGSGNDGMESLSEGEKFDNLKDDTALEHVISIEKDANSTENSKIALENAPMGATGIKDGSVTNVTCLEMGSSEVEDTLPPNGLSKSSNEVALASSGDDTSLQLALEPMHGVRDHVETLPQSVSETSNLTNTDKNDQVLESESGMVTKDCNNKPVENVNVEKIIALPCEAFNNSNLFESQTCGDMVLNNLNSTDNMVNDNCSLGLGTPSKSDSNSIERNVQIESENVNFEHLESENNMSTELSMNDQNTSQNLNIDYSNQQCGLTATVNLTPSSYFVTKSSDNLQQNHLMNAPSNSKDSSNAFNSTKSSQQTALFEVKSSSSANEACLKSGVADGNVENSSDVVTTNGSLEKIQNASESIKSPALTPSKHSLVTNQPQKSELFANNGENSMNVSILDGKPSSNNIFNNNLESGLPCTKSGSSFNIETNKSALSQMQSCSNLNRNTNNFNTNDGLGSKNMFWNKSPNIVQHNTIPSNSNSASMYSHSTGLHQNSNLPKMTTALQPASTYYSNYSINCSTSSTVCTFVSSTTSSSSFSSCTPQSCSSYLGKMSTSQQPIVSYKVENNSKMPRNSSVSCQIGKDQWFSNSNLTPPEKSSLATGICSSNYTKNLPSRHLKPNDVMQRNNCGHLINTMSSSSIFKEDFPRTDEVCPKLQKPFHNKSSMNLGIKNVQPSDKCIANLPGVTQKEGVKEGTKVKKDVAINTSNDQNIMNNIQKYNSDAQRVVTIPQQSSAPLKIAQEANFNRKQLESLTNSKNKMSQSPNNDNCNKIIPSKSIRKVVKKSVSQQTDDSGEILMGNNTTNEKKCHMKKGFRVNSLSNCQTVNKNQLMNSTEEFSNRIGITAAPKDRKSVQVGSDVLMESGISQQANQHQTDYMGSVSTTGMSVQNFKVDNKNHAETFVNRAKNDKKQEYKHSQLSKEKSTFLDDIRLALPHSEFSNDLFTSLQVPPGSQHHGSLSPTAAFLLAFPLVSNSKNSEILIDSDNQDAQHPAQTMLQLSSAPNNCQPNNNPFQNDTCSGQQSNQNCLPNYNSTSAMSLNSGISELNKSDGNKTSNVLQNDAVKANANNNNIANSQNDSMVEQQQQSHLTGNLNQKTSSVNNFDKCTDQNKPPDYQTHYNVQYDYLSNNSFNNYHCNSFKSTKPGPSAVNVSLAGGNNSMVGGSQSYLRDLNKPVSSHATTTYATSNEDVRFSYSGNQNETPLYSNWNAKPVMNLQNFDDFQMNCVTSYNHFQTGQGSKNVLTSDVPQFSSSGNVFGNLTYKNTNMDTNSIISSSRNNVFVSQSIPALGSKKTGGKTSSNDTAATYIYTQASTSSVPVTTRSYSCVFSSGTDFQSSVGFPQPLYSSSNICAVDDLLSTSKACASRNLMTVQGTNTATSVAISSALTKPLSAAAQKTSCATQTNTAKFFTSSSSSTTLQGKKPQVLFEEMSKVDNQNLEVNQTDRTFSMPCKGSTDFSLVPCNAGNLINNQGNNYSSSTNTNTDSLFVCQSSSYNTQSYQNSIITSNAGSTSSNKGNAELVKISTGSSQPRMPVNWMTMPDPRTSALEVSSSSYVPDRLFTPHKDALDFIAPIITGCGNLQPTYTAITNNSQMFYGLDLPSEGQQCADLMGNKISSSGNQMQTSSSLQYSWPTSKSSLSLLSHLDNHGLGIPSTLPTLVGDLALGTNTGPSTPADTVYRVANASGIFPTPEAGEIGDEKKCNRPTAPPKSANFSLEVPNSSVVPSNNQQFNRSNMAKKQDNFKGKSAAPGIQPTPGLQSHSHKFATVDSSKSTAQQSSSGSFLSVSQLVDEAKTDRKRDKNTNSSYKFTQNITTDIYYPDGTDRKQRVYDNTNGVQQGSKIVNSNYGTMNKNPNNAAGATQNNRSGYSLPFDGVTSNQKTLKPTSKTPSTRKSVNESTAATIQGNYTDLSMSFMSNNLSVPVSMTPVSSTVSLWSQTSGGCSNNTSNNVCSTLKKNDAFSSRSSYKGGKYSAESLIGADRFVQDTMAPIVDQFSSHYGTCFEPAGHNTTTIDAPLSSSHFSSALFGADYGHHTDYGSSQNNQAYQNCFNFGQSVIDNSQLNASSLFIADNADFQVNTFDSSTPYLFTAPSAPVNKKFANNSDGVTASVPTTSNDPKSTQKPHKDSNFLASSSSRPSLSAANFIPTTTAASFTRPSLSAANFVPTTAPASFSRPSLSATNFVQTTTSGTFSHPSLSAANFVPTTTPASFSRPSLSTANFIQTTTAASFFGHVSQPPPTYKATALPPAAAAPLSVGNRFQKTFPPSAAVAPNCSTAANHSSSTNSLANFNMSTIFPEMNDKQQVDANNVSLCTSVPAPPFATAVAASATAAPDSFAPPPFAASAPRHQAPPPGSGGGGDR